MTEAHERLTHYIKTQGFELKDFCAQFGFVYNSFTQILAGTRPLGRKIIDQLADALPNMSIDWLLYGRGQMELTDKNISNKNVSYSEVNETISLPDPFEEMLLKYLDREKIREKLNIILKNK